MSEPLALCVVVGPLLHGHFVEIHPLIGGPDAPLDVVHR